MQKQFADRIGEIRAEGELEVQLGGRPFCIKKQFLDDLEASSIRANVERLGRALLVMHSTGRRDRRHRQRPPTLRGGQAPKSFISLDNADHLLSKRRDAEYAASVLAAWAWRYLPEVETSHEDASLDEALPEGQVEVSETGASQFATQVRAGRHVLPADEPVRVGGTDTGPTPYDYLLAALGACTSMTLRMYAQRQKLALEKVTVRLSHQRVHVDDCND